MKREAVSIKPTQFTVSLFPEDDEERIHWDVRIEYRGDGWWAVVHFSRCLGKDGLWDYETSDNRGDEKWRSSHRFILTDAIVMAERIAPLITVNGLSALARKQRER